MISATNNVNNNVFMIHYLLYFHASVLSFIVFTVFVPMVLFC